MNHKKTLFLLLLLTNFDIYFSPAIHASEKNKIELTGKRLVDTRIQPSLGLENIFLEGIVSLIEKKVKRIVIRDQSILVNSETVFINEDSSRPFTLRDLKVGSGIRVSVIYEKGELLASSIDLFDKPKKGKLDDEDYQETSTILFD